MNGAHLHLLLNHVPVIGMVAATLLLLWAVRSTSAEMRRVALLALVVVGLMALPAYFTGEPAEDTIEHMAGVEKTHIEEHEAAAKYGLASALVAAAVAAVGLWRSRGKTVSRGLVGVALVLALFATSVFARVATLGGEIRHPEIRGAGAGAPAAAGGERAEPGGEHDGDRD